MCLSFDTNFKNSKHIKFYPYVGIQYNNSSPKVLILGESHYHSKDDKSETNPCNNDNDLTRNVVAAKKHKAFFKTISMLSNLVIDNDRVYDKIAFYNFFQDYVGCSPSDKSKITDGLITTSRLAFYEVMGILEPDLIIAWGISKLYHKWMPQDSHTIISDNRMFYSYDVYPNTKIWHSKHPSCYEYCMFEATEQLKAICETIALSYPIF